MLDWIKSALYKGKKPEVVFEKVDSTPVALPVGFQRPPTLQEQIARVLRSHEFNMRMHSQGIETFEEADDFDIPDDPIDPSTPWEKDYDLAAISAERAGLVDPPKPPKKTYREYYAARKRDKKVADADEEVRAPKEPKTASSPSTLSSAPQKPEVSGS